MKIKFYYLLLLIITILACQSQKETKQVDTIAAPITERVASETKTQVLLRAIMGTGEGLLRGIKFGDPIAEVKKKETLELFEEEVSHIGYTLDTDNLETVDILYEKDIQSKISGIQLDIYMNTDASNDSLQNAMGSLFTVRYGKPSQSADITTWRIKPDGQVSIKSVKNKLDRGLEIRFAKK